jgi:predicted transcriptional regulator
MVGDLIQTLFRGDPQALLAHLVSERDVAPGDLERVRALLAQSETKETPR